MERPRDSTRKYDDRQAIDYDSIRRGSPVTASRLIEALGMGLDDKRPRILSLGCGTGNYEAILAQHGDVIGIDIKLDMLDKTREKLQGLVEIQFPLLGRGLPEAVVYQGDAFKAGSSEEVRENGATTSTTYDELV